MVALREDLLAEEVDVLARVAGAGLDVDAMLVVQNTYRAASALRARLEATALSGEGLTWASFTMLFCLWVWGPAETRRLAERMGVARPTVSGVTDTLERRGLVERRGAAGDRRLRVVALTPAGTTTFTGLFPRFNTQEQAAVSGLEPGESRELARLLRKLVQSARRRGDEAWQST
jgi:MarR family transcriptional regulator, organic hydroperoxide resistance regulator